MHPVTLQAIRQAEIEGIRPFLPTRGRILEIGAGQGWQAAQFSQWGYAVSALDIQDSQQADKPQFPIQVFNGVDLPYADGFFDVVFSSSVMEHVVSFAPLQKEIHRVLKPGGIVIHIVPNAVWRIWTSLVHYLVCLRYPRKLLFSFFPKKHGAEGNVFTECILFSRVCWKIKFSRQGWRIVKCFSNKLFYTGQLVFAKRLNMGKRRFLAYLLGGVCTVFILKTHK
jgi:SAM-dependent methyltransferase